MQPLGLLQLETLSQASDFMGARYLSEHLAVLPLGVPGRHSRYAFMDAATLSQAL